jgi:hypothetical protein
MKYLDYSIMQNKAIINGLATEFSKNILKMNDSAADKILKYIDEEKIVRIDLNTKEIDIKGNSDSFENFIYGSKQEEIATILRNDFLGKVDAHINIDLIIYNQTMLELADAGYIITDKNREEKYLEILETGDESLIDLLEQYLVLKDKITFIISQKKTYNNIIEKLRTLNEDSEEFKDLYIKYIGGK